MRLFDFACSKNCGRQFEAYINDDDDVVECPTCKIPATKQLGGRPMCHSQSSHSDYDGTLSSSYNHDHRIIDLGTMNLPITEKTTALVHMALVECKLTPKGKA